MKIRIALAMALVAGQAAAQLVDPTQPPASILEPRPEGAVAPAAPRGPQLQSILISPKRRVAVIDGETVRQGEQFKGALLAQVSETEVVLVRGQSREVLKLHPASDVKRPNKATHNDK